MAEAIKVTGYDALDYLTTQALGVDTYIIEHDTGIDVDNAARYYDHESQTDYSHVLWSVLNYSDLRKLPEGYAIDDLFSAEVIAGVRNGSTDSRVVSFSINTYIFDSEDRGTYYEFLYPLHEDVPADDVSVSWDVDLPGTPDGEDVVWREVDGRFYEGATGKVCLMVKVDDGEVVTVTLPKDHMVSTRQWVQASLLPN